MKKTISLILLIAVLASALCVLGSCSGGEDDVPKGMQLVKGGEDVGYYFFGPEEWVIANQGEIAVTYVSSVDYSSVSFTESDVNYNLIGTGDNPYLNGVQNAFSAAEDGYRKEPFSDYELKINCESATFGNADKAFKYVFNYTYLDKPYTCMQIFVGFNGASYIFTFNASAKEYSEEDGSYYQFYLNEKVQPIIDNFKFVEKSNTDKEPIVYPTDDEGNLLVSEKSKCGFKLWVDPEYKVDFASGMVSVTNDNGANITVSKLINSSISIKENFLERCELLSYVSDRRVNQETGVEEADFDVILGVQKKDDGTEYMQLVDVSCARSAALVEYRYTIGAQSYRVYQVYLVKGYFDVKAFVFTFTCPEEIFEEEIVKAKNILADLEL